MSQACSSTCGSVLAHAHLRTSCKLFFSTQRTLRAAAAYRHAHCVMLHPAAAAQRPRAPHAAVYRPIEGRGQPVHQPRERRRRRACAAREAREAAKVELEHRGPAREAHVPPGLRWQRGPPDVLLPRRVRRRRTFISPLICD